VICENCKYPYANPLGCISCGWKYTENYHPAIGAAPVETAYWLVSQSRETLERLYGPIEASNKVVAAKLLIAEVEKAKPPAPLPDAVVESHVVAEAAKPDFSQPATEEFAPAPEPVPIVDERKFAKEAAPPVGE
jgi:hypothetical protein